MYNIPDADLLQSGEITATTLPEDIASFTAFDSTLTSSLPDQIRTAISRTKTVHPDDIVVQEQADLTNAMKEEQSSCTIAFQSIAYFVRKAYPNSTAMQKLFGLSEYKNAVNNKNKFIRFMEELSITTEEHRADLIRCGCNTALIDSLPVRAKSLLEADRAQEMFKRNRGQITQDRVVILNELYKLLQPVDEVAQIIFRNDTARMAKYLLPRQPKSPSDAPTGKNTAPES
jgi:hypothetical protein